MTRYLFIAAMAIATLTGCNKNTQQQSQPTEDSIPIVYMTQEISPAALVNIYEALGRKAEGRVAVKISTGEKGGHNFLQPRLIEVR